MVPWKITVKMDLPITLGTQYILSGNGTLYEMLYRKSRILAQLQLVESRSGFN